MTRAALLLVLALATSLLAASAAQAQSFVVRGSVGFGYGRGESDPNLRIEGIGLVWSVAPSIDLTERFGLHLELWGSSLENDGPILLVNDQRGRYDVVAGGLGASVLLPLELRLSLSGGGAFSRTTKRLADASSGWGWAASLRIDRTVRVGRHVSLGAGALLSYARTLDGDGPRGFSIGLALIAAFD